MLRARNYKAVTRGLQIGTNYRYRQRIASTGSERELFRSALCGFSQEISYACLGGYKSGSAGLCFDFSSQPSDMNPEAINWIAGIVSPYVPGDFRVC